jgi:hypothetical protein
VSNSSQINDRTAHEQEHRGPSEPTNVANHNLLSFLFGTDHRNLDAFYSLLCIFNGIQTG